MSTRSVVQSICPTLYSAPTAQSHPWFTHGRWGARRDQTAYHFTAAPKRGSRRRLLWPKRQPLAMATAARPQAPGRDSALAAVARAPWAEAEAAGWAPASRGSRKSRRSNCLLERCSRSLPPPACPSSTQDSRIGRCPKASACTTTAVRHGPRTSPTRRRNRRRTGTPVLAQARRNSRGHLPLLHHRYPQASVSWTASAISAVSICRRRVQHSLSSFREVSSTLAPASVSSSTYRSRSPSCSHS